jgi:hypothetical protein
MTYLDQWKALASRVRGLTQAGQLHADYLKVRSSDSFGRAKALRQQSASILTALEAFRDRFRQSLPPAALAAVENFISQSASLIRNDVSNPDLREESTWAALVMLAALETEISFLLSDVQQSIRARSERAFAHLQRSIVADADIRAKWQAALKDGEVACEKLGAVHLLLHGIWAFKVDAAGERTDLVFQERARDIGDEERYADGLVLTEWKVAAAGDRAENRFRDARSQAGRYARGSLAGNELTAYRYAIVVSSQHIDTPGDLTENGVVYRHINIAVDPRSPSRS